MSTTTRTLRYWCARIVHKTWFRYSILGVIILNAIVIGMETYPWMMENFYGYLKFIDRLCLMIFVVEIGMKIIAKGSFRAFFHNRWDTFDFVIVALAVLPYGLDAVDIARIFRLLRVLRTITFMPQLKLLISTLLRTLPSLGNIVILLSLLFYFYAVMGAVLFADIMPEEFGTLGRAALTLFGIVTLEGWVEVMKEAGKTNPHAWIYFLSFILLGTFIIINLFVAVVVSNLEQTFREQEAAELAKGLSHAALLQRLQLMFAQQTTYAGELEILVSTIERTFQVTRTKDDTDENPTGD